MELKFADYDNSLDKFSGSNRTFMELKLFIGFEFISTCKF